jgi:protein-S-isoprenylcysteine O-methyltransferase Ste14
MIHFVSCHFLTIRQAFPGAPDAGNFWTQTEVLMMPVIITTLPVLFLTMLIISTLRFRRMRLDLSGTPPIRKSVFLTAKYSIILIWSVMIVHSWGIDLSFIKVPRAAEWTALLLWISGFIIMFTGKITLGRSFRIGSPMEKTELRIIGIYRFSRNPMYLGVSMTIIAACLFTLNPVVMLLGIFIIAVHHAIALAEEKHLRKLFGKKYTEYCRYAGRYLPIFFRKNATRN